MVSGSEISSSLIPVSESIQRRHQTMLPPSRIQTIRIYRFPYIIQSSIGVETNPFKLFRLTTNYQYQRGVHLLHGRNLNAPVPGLGRPDPTVGNITNIESSAYQSSHRLMVGIGPAKFARQRAVLEHELPADEEHQRGRQSV